MAIVASTATYAALRAPHAALASLAMSWRAMRSARASWLRTR